MIYQITYNETVFYPVGNIHNAVITMAGVSDWWHYLHNVYLVDSKQTQKQIADQIHAQFPLLNFLVVKVDLEGSNGILPKEAWDWINNKTGINTPLEKLLGLPPMPKTT